MWRLWQLDCVSCIVEQVKGSQDGRNKVGKSVMGGRLFLCSCGRLVGAQGRWVVYLCQAAAAPAKATGCPVEKRPD